MRRRDERKDPLKSRKPEQVTSRVGTGGKLQVGYQQALLASLPGGVSGLSGSGGGEASYVVFDVSDERLLSQKKSSTTQARRRQKRGDGGHDGAR